MCITPHKLYDTNKHESKHLYIAVPSSKLYIYIYIQLYLLAKGLDCPFLLIGDANRYVRISLYYILLSNRWPQAKLNASIHIQDSH